MCKLLLENGASLDALQAFTSSMDLKRRSRLLDPLITRCLDNGSTSVYIVVLRFLVSIVLGINDGENGNGLSSQSMMKVAIDMSHDLAVRAIIHLEPWVLVVVDATGRTPLVYATIKHQEAICKLLLEKGASVEPLKSFTGSMDLKAKSELLDQSLKNAMMEGLRSETVIRLLLLMALGGDRKSTRLNSSHVD